MLTRLELDDAADRLLAALGYDHDSVPPEGEIVFLRKTANLSTGGTAIDVTDVIHPDNKLMAERAIRAVGLDIGGVDFLTTDITQSYRDNGGAICEINAGPGMRMHIAPSEGKGRDVGGAVMDMLFPAGTPSRIPIAALTGTNGKTTTARMLAHVLKMAGFVVGQTSTDAVYIDGNVTVKGDMTGPKSAGMVLRDPMVDMAVIETARGGIVRAGLGYRFCDVGAVLNVTSDHLGLGGVNSLDELAEVKRLVVEVAKDCAVLNADNEYTLKMAAHTQAKRICYVTRNALHPLVREHIKLGQPAVVLEQGLNGDQIVIYDHGHQLPLIWTHLIPATVEGKALHNVENAMFTAAMAYALGLSLDQIRNGPQDLRQHLLPVARPDEHLRRARLPRHPRLRPQRGRRRRHGRPRRAPAAARQAHRLRHRPRRPPRPGHPRHRREGRRPLRHLPLPRRRQPPRPRPRRGAEADEGRAHGLRRLRGRHPVPRQRDGLASRPRSRWPGPTTSCSSSATASPAAWKQIIYFRPKEAPKPVPPERLVAAAGFDVPEGYRILSDERGVRIVPRD